MNIPEPLDEEGALTAQELRDQSARAIADESTRAMLLFAGLAAVNIRDLLEDDHPTANDELAAFLDHVQRAVDALRGWQQLPRVKVPE